MKNISMNLRIFMAEFYGTFLILFLGFGSLYIIQDTLVSSLLIGASVFLATTVLSHISFAHFNPLFSLAAFLNQRIRLKRLGLYLFAQVSGALFAVISLRLFSLEPLLIEETISLFNGLGIEIFMVFIIVYIYLAVSENASKKILLGIALALGYMATFYLGSTQTYLLLNPARLLEFLIISQPILWTELLFYILAGIIGVLLATLFYTFLAYQPIKYQTITEETPNDTHK
jgi:aquaporin Z